MAASFSTMCRAAACLVLAAAAAAPAPIAAPAPAPGGTLRLAAAASGGTIDPQVNYRVEFIQVFAALTDQLVTFRKAAAPEGYELVPDLAEALPRIEENGRRYIFTLRPGLRFSDGAALGVADVAASLRRIFLVHGPNASSWFSLIDGADTCLAHADRCALRGVTTDPATRTIAITLTRPSAEFLMALALPGASILPAGTPPHDLGITPFPTTGPYRIASYVPQTALILSRNPYFHVWNAQAQPAGVADRIEYRFGLSDQAAITAVENNQQDWDYDFKPLDRLDEIGRHYAARARISPMHAYAYLEMNTRIPPFDNEMVRQAVALAVDRRVLLNLFGGPAMARPACQLIPPGLPGYVADCPFSNPPGPTWIAPDPARARALVAKAGATGAPVTLITTDWPVDRNIGIYLQGVLNAIGLHADVRSLSAAIEFTYLSNSANHAQIGLTAAEEDFPSPADFVGSPFRCSSWRPNSDVSDNMTGFCDPSIDAALDRAETLSASNPVAGAAAWAGIDRRVTLAAPEVPLFLMNNLDIVSSRVRNYVFSPLYHMLISQVSVR